MKIFFKESLLEISKLFSEVLEPVYLTTILPTLCSSFSFSISLPSFLKFCSLKDVWICDPLECIFVDGLRLRYNHFFQMHNQLSQNKLIVFTPLTSRFYMYVILFLGSLVLLSVSSSVAHCLTYCSFMKSYYWVGQVFFVSFLQIVLALCFFTLILEDTLCQVLFKLLRFFIGLHWNYRFF